MFGRGNLAHGPWLLAGFSNGVHSCVLIMKLLNIFHQVFCIKDVLHNSKLMESGCSFVDINTFLLSFLFSHLSLSRLGLNAFTHCVPFITPLFF